MQLAQSIDRRTLYAIAGIIALAVVAFVAYEIANAVSGTDGPTQAEHNATFQVASIIAADQETLRGCRGIGASDMAEACVDAIGDITEWCRDTVAARDGIGPVLWGRLDAACDEWHQALIAKDGTEAGKHVSSFISRYLDLYD